MKRFLGGAAAAAGLTAACALIAACAQSRIIKVTPPSAPPPFSAARKDGWKTADSLWALRADPIQAWAALTAYRAAAGDQPAVPELLARYARACHLVATYAERNNPERRRGLYLEGQRAAEAALRLYPAFDALMRETGNEDEAVRSVEGPYLEAAYWYAANMAPLVLAEDVPSQSSNRNRLEAFLRQIARHDEPEYYNGTDRLLGTLLLNAPKPRTDTARVCFQKAINAAPLYFETRTWMAEQLAVRERDSVAFQDQLEWVLRTPPDTLPEAGPENRYEQARARDLLARKAEFFR